MKDNQFQLAGCSGKQQYETRLAVDKSIRAQKARNNNKTKAPYKCEYCGKWHVGHKDHKNEKHGNK
jgi:hypothetical protein